MVGKNNKMTPLTQGAFYRNYHIVRTLASCPGVNFDAQVSSVGLRESMYMVMIELIRTGTNDFLSLMFGSFHRIVMVL